MTYAPRTQCVGVQTKNCDRVLSVHVGGSSSLDSS
jgi:hypothetical protein